MAAEPPLAPDVRDAACCELLRRSALVENGTEMRLRCALASLKAGSLPPELKCHANLQTGALFYELTQESAQAVQYIRVSLSLCSRPLRVSERLRVSVLCASTSMLQGLVEEGCLKDARVLLETLQGVLQQPSEAGASASALQYLDGDVVAQQLRAHTSVLQVSLLQREGQLTAAERAVHTALEAIESLPESVESELRSTSADDGREHVPWAPREALQGVAHFLHALVLAQQGETASATSKLDELLSAAADAPMGSPPAMGSPRGGSTAAASATDASSRLVAASRAGLADEARLLRASMHLAALEFDDAIAIMQQLSKTLCAPADKASGGFGGGLQLRRRHGRTSFLLLQAHAALSLEQPKQALPLVRKAKAAFDASGHRHFALQQWMELLLLLLDDERDPSDSAALQEGLKRLGVHEEAKAHRLLRAAVTLHQGETSLAQGNAEEAERRLARAVKLSVGETRCDVITAVGLTSLAAAVCAQKGDEPATPGEAAEAGEGDEGEGGRRRRTEDSLSSALMLSARIEDLHAQRRALHGWATHYEAIGDDAQAKAFGDLHADFEDKLKRKLEEGESERRRVLQKLADKAGK